MANLFITEFDILGSAADGQAVQAVRVPPVAQQRITYTSSTQSVAFQDATRVVRLVADADVYIKWGNDGDTVTALATDMLIPAGTVEYFTVNLDGTTNRKLAAYDGST